jgi:hypothetical protein
MRRFLTLLLALAGLLGGSVVVSPPAGAAAFPSSVPLPTDFQPEGIAVGPGSTFYAGSLTTGDIYRGDLRTGAGSVFVDAPPGRAALGLKVDQARHLLVVAGGFTGAVYVYDTRTGAGLAELQLTPPGTGLLNDVVITRTAAYVTDSFRPVLYVVPISAQGQLGTPRTLALTGAATFLDPAAPNLNGIDATADGRTLVVGHAALGQLFTIDPRTGASSAIDVTGLVPGTPDGLLLQGKSLWVVENFANTLVRVTLSPDLTRGTITATVTSPLFHVPTTVARHGDRLALVNGRFDLGLPPPFGAGAPPGTTFDVVVVRAH